MQTSNYDGPRGGDYVRYVDALLRASPVYRDADAVARGAATLASDPPGVQPASPLASLREQVKVPAQAGSRPSPKAATAALPPRAEVPVARRQPRRPRLALESEQEARREALRLAQTAAPWWRITPGRIVFALVLAVLAATSPGMAMMACVIGVIHVLRGWVHSLGK